MKIIKFLKLIPFFLLLLANTSFARTLIVNGDFNINKPTVYKNVTIDLNHGRFVIDKKASLGIEDSVINVTISPENPYFVLATSGTLELKNNIFNVTTSNIPQDANNQSIYYLIRILDGYANIINNSFSVDKFFTVGLLVTEPGATTSKFVISGNRFANFHGGLYLINSNTAKITNNLFTNVSFSNLFYVGTNTTISNNTFRFPGNLNLGDAIDILNSNTVVLNNNIISSSSSYGIAIGGSENIRIENNRIMDGLSHGIFINNSQAILKQYKYLYSLKTNMIKNKQSNHIKVLKNYLSQNRFGLAADSVDGLDVEFNQFIQKFSDAATRQFWTDNTNLIVNTSNQIWANNLYKEAFTQEVPGDNSLALKFVPYPAIGGVVY